MGSRKLIIESRRFWATDVNRKFMFLPLARFYVRPLSFKALILAFTTWHLQRKRRLKLRIPVGWRPWLKNVCALSSPWYTQPWCSLQDVSKKPHALFSGIVSYPSLSRNLPYSWHFWWIMSVELFVYPVGLEVQRVALRCALCREEKRSMWSWGRISAFTITEVERNKVTTSRNKATIIQFSNYYTIEEKIWQTLNPNL